jgi:hypothetical protein
MMGRAREKGFFKLLFVFARTILNTFYPASTTMLLLIIVISPYEAYPQYDVCDSARGGADSGLPSRRCGLLHLYSSSDPRRRAGKWYHL